MNEQTVLTAKYIDSQIEADFPAFVAVDDGRTASYNANGSKEHFWVVVGKQIETNRSNSAYLILVLNAVIPKAM